jgi:hypothetical protein
MSNCCQIGDFQVDLSPNGKKLHVAPIKVEVEDKTEGFKNGTRPQFSQTDRWVSLEDQRLRMKCQN